MGLLDRIRRRHDVVGATDAPVPGFSVVFGDPTSFVTDDETLDLMRRGRASRRALEQYLVLDLLTDEGRAVATDGGFAVPAEEVARLEADDARLLGLPARFSGDVVASTIRWTASPGFRVDLALRLGDVVAAPQRHGPVVRAAGRLHRLSVPLLRALVAIETHGAPPVDERTEAENVRLVARLQAAQQLAIVAVDPADRDESFRLSLGSLSRFATVRPTSVGIIVEPQDDGALLVQPDLGPEVSRELVSRRWHQLDHCDAGGAVMRVDDTLVLLEADQLAGVGHVRERPRIPADEVQQFLRAPGSYYDPELVNLDAAFGVRVAGLGVVVPVPFTEAASNGLDWFARLDSVGGPEALVDAGSSPMVLSDLERAVSEAWEAGETLVTVEGEVFAVSDHDRVEKALAEAQRRLKARELEAAPRTADRVPAGGRRVTVGMHLLEVVDPANELRELAAGASPQRPVDYATLRRTPFAHQRVGIEWMTALMQAALDAPDDNPVRIKGALLADDMGLGKTFMTLAALREALLAQSPPRDRPLPTLAVMPAGLLTTWLSELEKTFGSEHGPFEDVVVLRGEGLAPYRSGRAGCETSAPVADLDADGMVRPDRIHASLRIGPEHGDGRLDRPGVLVLTTYQTLQRYQVSLGLVDWGVVVLDEAQVTKNPETLAARATKALKSRFTLLVTGTPVENSLRDFWSLVDTAQPGLLGTWSHFQDAWVRPMREATDEEHQRLGRALREEVGGFMLRRVKEDHLQDLPTKHVHEYREPMPAAQVQSYDNVLAGHQRRAGGPGAALKTLHELSAVCLHPGLLRGRLSEDAAGLDESARTVVAVRDVLDDVRSKDEKAIVFTKTREVQRGLALWLSERYGIRVDVVNGETPATGPGDTRLKKIDAFEAREGFNVIIISPLAAGVGLTVVGANHAIHLERHWNPAKEAQATDRIYRIGQEREVHVHLPVAMHPVIDSFDLNLDRLLRSKVALKDAVVVPQEVSQEDMQRAMGLE